MRRRDLKVVVKSVMVVAAVVAIVSGVTFAALQSQQDILTGNTIETATANLVVSKDDIHYANSQAGFDFSGLVPGGAAMPITGNSFYLKNSGQTRLTLKMAVSSVPSNPNNVDLSKVNVLLTTVGSGLPAQNFTLQQLMNNGGVSFASLDNNNSMEYKLQVSMTSDALVGASAALGNIDFAFYGTAVSS